MASFNKCIIMGHLTRDPQIKYLPNQTAVADGGIACNRKFKTAAGEDREEVLFQDFVAFGRTAEVIGQYFTKGKPILLEGHLKTEQWTDKQTEQKRSKNVLVIESFQFVGGNNDRGGEDREEERAPPVDRGQMRGRAPAPIEQQLGEQFDDTEVPI
jgi:single-strand DNA-binding protein